jgi:putative multiple sugar transport system permease protein
LVNLVNQSGYIAVLAVGMTLVIVIRHIDLSVGFLAGFLGAVAAIAMVSWKLPVWVVIPLIMTLGIVAGLITSFLVAVLGVPAFVATLAGWLGYRGALQLVTRATGMQIASQPARSSARSVSTASWISAPSRTPQPDKRTPTFAMSELLLRSHARGRLSGV